MLNQKIDGWPTKTNVPEPNAEALKYGMSKLHLSAALDSKRKARKCIIRKIWIAILETLAGTRRFIMLQGIITLA